jgi:PKD repeat protein
VGTDARSNDPRSVDIRLVAPGVISPSDPAVPDFTITPEEPVQGADATFNASDPLLDAILVVYRWNFGDGSTASGRVVKHRFGDPGNYPVTLTVTDADGNTDSRSKTVTVVPSAEPQAEFVFSPSTPNVGDTVFFNASTSAASPGRTIVSYRWNFGNSTSTVSGIIVSRVFTVADTYNVTLTVTDDVGVTASTSKTVNVAP